MRTRTRAIWNGAVIASTDHYILVDGNVYFPPSSVEMQYAEPSDTHTTCEMRCNGGGVIGARACAGWKGQVTYYTIEVDGKQNKDAAWFYPSPKPAANNIKTNRSGEPRLVQLYWIPSPSGKKFRLGKLPSFIRDDRDGRDYRCKEV